MRHIWALPRQQFQVVKNAATVRQVKGKCLFYRKRNVKPGEELMANLSENGLKENFSPFPDLRIGYFGPLLVNQCRSEIN